MAVESAADRAGFLADFGESISWTVGVVTSTVTVLGHRGSIRIDVQEGADVLNTRATVQVVESDLPSGAAAGNAVSFRGVAHTVKSIEKDGTGMVVVLLEEVVAD